jgi:hypothetical protein
VSAYDHFARSFDQRRLVYLGSLRVYRLPASRWPRQKERREPVNPQANHHAWKLADVVNCVLKPSSLCTYCAYRVVRFLTHGRRCGKAGVDLKVWLKRVFEETMSLAREHCSDLAWIDLSRVRWRGSKHEEDMTANIKSLCALIAALIEQDASKQTSGENDLPLWAEVKMNGSAVVVMIITLACGCRWVLTVPISPRRCWTSSNAVM